MMEVACGQVEMCGKYILQRELTQQMLIIYIHIQLAIAGLPMKLSYI